MDIFLDILLKPPQPLMGLFFLLKKHLDLLKTIKSYIFTRVFNYSTRKSFNN